MPTRRTRKSDIEAKTTSLRALSLRTGGASYDAIGRELGISKEGARKAVARELAELDKLCREEAEVVRQLEARRLDEMMLSLWPRARGKDAELKAIGMVLRIQERRARLLGLDVDPDEDDGKNRDVEIRFVIEQPAPSHEGLDAGSETE